MIKILNNKTRVQVIAKKWTIGLIIGLVKILLHTDAMYKISFFRNCPIEYNLDAMFRNLVLTLLRIDKYKYE